MLEFIKNLFFKKDKEEFFVAPCVGDVVEFEDGSRNMVVYSKFEKNVLDVRFLESVDSCLTPRGRQKTVIVASNSAQSWPPKNCIVLRDGMQIYPQKNWRINLVEKLSKLILKKG